MYRLKFVGCFYSGHLPRSSKFQRFPYVFRRVCGRWSHFHQEVFVYRLGSSTTKIHGFKRNMLNLLCSKVIVVFVPTNLFACQIHDFCAFLP